MKVMKWGPYDLQAPQAVGGMGGFFADGMRWEDFLDHWGSDAVPYLEALRTEIIAKRIRFGGDYHQRSAMGMPVFDDGKVAVFTYRAWGDLLAAVWSTEEDCDYCYMDFYMGVEE